MIVCHCHAVTDREIRKAAREGALTAEMIADRCNAGAGCGDCQETVEEIIMEVARPLVSVTADRIFLSVVATPHPDTPAGT